MHIYDEMKDRLYGTVVMCLPCDREVVGSMPGCDKPMSFFYAALKKKPYRCIVELLSPFENLLISNFSSTFRRKKSS